MTHEELDNILFDSILSLTKNKKISWYVEKNSFFQKAIAYYRGFAIRIHELSISIEKEEDPGKQIILVKMQNEKKFLEIKDMVLNTEVDNLFILKNEFISEIAKD